MPYLNEFGHVLQITERMVKACDKYEAWKTQNRPEFKPWRWPDQIEGEFIDWDDVTGPQQEDNESENLSELAEQDVAIEDYETD